MASARWEAQALSEKDIDQPVDSTISEAPPPPFSECTNLVHLFKTDNIIVVRPRDDLDTQQMRKNAELRLLMTLVGMERTDEEDEITWTIPFTLPTEDLTQNLSFLSKHVSKPLTEVDGYTPSELIKRVTVSSETYHDEGDPLTGFLAGSESEGTDGEEEFLFPANIRSRTNPSIPEELKQRRRLTKRKRRSSSGSIDESLIEERRKAREEAALARRRAIKSELYVHDSDDDPAE